MSGTYEWDACAADDEYNSYNVTMKTFSRRAEDGSYYILTINKYRGGAWELEGTPLYRVSGNVSYIHILFVRA